MRRLSFRNLVNADGVRFDRIEVELGTWRVSGTVADIDAFRRSLGIPPKDQRETQSSLHGWIFRAPDNSGGLRRSMQVRRSKFEWGSQNFGTPLFQGAVKFSKYFNENSNLETQTYLRLAIQINPTRWILHQGNLSETDKPHMMRQNLPDEFGGEFSLDGRDNWIPDDEEFFENSDPQSSFGSVQRYLDAVIDSWEEELHRANEFVSPISWQRIDRLLNLKSVESYWEFISDDPTGAVAMLERPMRAFGEKLSVVREFQVQVDEERVVNSRALRIESRTGETIRIYAKTNRRIRFEVIHSLSGQRRFQEISPHTDPQWQIEQLLNFTAGKAAKALNKFFAYLGKMRKLAPSQKSSIRLLLEIIRVSGEHAEDILCLLIHNGSISSRSTAARPILKQLHALRRKGILESSGCTYVVTSSYRMALDALQKHASDYPSKPGEGPLNFLPFD
ncbi:MAG: hypothetical protein P1U87_09310 [Verrucomicrobiales bacterium]|nr:hypothetical protein [Verrucomicrobiales bacterium]